MNVGFPSIPASVYQMMSGPELLFAALFALLSLKRLHLNKYHGMGVSCCVMSNSKQAASGSFTFMNRGLRHDLGFRV
jgi:hypothetical protein